METDRDRKTYGETSLMQRQSMQGRVMREKNKKSNADNRAIKNSKRITRCLCEKPKTLKGQQRQRDAMEKSEVEDERGRKKMTDHENPRLEGIPDI